MAYVVTMNGHDVNVVFGDEAAWSAYIDAEEFAIENNALACLVVAHTGEIIADSTGYRA